MHLGLLICFVVAVYSGSTLGFTTTNPSFDAYTPVAIFSCGEDNPSIGEVIELTEICGSLLSPCFGVRNYPLEITEGLRLWYINFPQPIAGLRLIAHNFETNNINAILYIGRTVVLPTGIFGVTRDFEIYGSLSAGAESSANPFTFLKNANEATRDGNKFYFTNVEPFFMSFYSSLEPSDTGFNVSYCLDVDECTDSRFCTNSARGTCVREGFEKYSCNCNDGYTGAHCEWDVNECLLNKCDPIAKCINLEGTFTCTCPNGYRGNGIVTESCKDIDECADSTLNNCSVTGSKCTNIPGSFTCSCLVGYSGDGSNCILVDECAAALSHPCHPDAKCIKKSGTFQCACKIGFAGDGLTCSDIDECQIGPPVAAP
uniref:Uncharacterized protein LOC104266258 n=1 Tax=Phallusia mammillata TaxID=59560 RepID=A0A6F9DJ92_9ASCI|nr:uncharacterized protein LOC104266258 [Phallusia mammillata]